MAELVAVWPRAPVIPGNANNARRLSDEDFEFRGGTSHSVNGGMLHRRAGEDDLPGQ
jgi:hypothetical protein